MAPSISDSVDGLKSLVDKLEKRIEDLESRLRSDNGQAPVEHAGELRMVIMGPPGAGKLIFVRS
jgi:adenylate kinase